MTLPGETEAASAGKQPCPGIARRAHRREQAGASEHGSAPLPSFIGSVDADALKISARRAAYPLTANALLLFQLRRYTRMMKHRLENILTYLKHGITNADSEALHAKIQRVKYTARGFHNQQNFITAIYFHCGGLDLAP